MEARVYKDPDNPNFVLKVIYNYKNFSETPLGFLDNRISLHNYLFGDSGTHYELIGFTETYGATKGVEGKFFAPVVRQAYVIGSELKDSELPLLISEKYEKGTQIIREVEKMFSANPSIIVKTNEDLANSVNAINYNEQVKEAIRHYFIGGLSLYGKVFINTLPHKTGNEIIRT